MYALLDTHILAWALADPGRLKFNQRAAIDSAQQLYLSAISIYEIGQKIRLGKWSEMIDAWQGIDMLLMHLSIEVININAPIARQAAEMDWANRDPFDRLIAATAIEKSLTLLTADQAFEDVRPQIALLN